MARSAVAMISAILALAAGGLGIGWATGFPVTGLVLGILTYPAVLVVGVRGIVRWVDGGSVGDPPRTAILLPDVVDAIRRASRKAQAGERRLRRALSRVGVAADALPEALVAVDEAGHVLWSNRAAHTLLGLTETDIGEPLSSRVRDSALAKHLEEEAFRASAGLASPVGDSPALSVNLVPYGADQRLLIARDVTRLQQLARTRRDFISSVSHELRTPLTVVTGYLETMAESEEFSRGRWHTPVSQMVAQAARMGDVVADLLHLANLEAGEDADREASVPVPKLLLSIREDAVALSRDAPHEITLDCAPDLWLLGVESELRSAFSNLVFNAVRYTPPPGQIDIRWRRDGQGARFSVQDDGEGIAAEHLPRITERFYRVDVARSRDAGGTGLGLAIVKHVLRQHGAELEIESEPGVGSTFTCHFPADRILPLRARRALA